MCGCKSKAPIPSRPMITSPAPTRVAQFTGDAAGHPASFDEPRTQSATASVYLPDESAKVIIRRIYIQY